MQTSCLWHPLLPGTLQLPIAPEIPSPMTVALKAFDAFGTHGQALPGPFGSTRMPWRLGQLPGGLLVLGNHHGAPAYLLSVYHGSQPVRNISHSCPWPPVLGSQSSDWVLPD